MKYEYKCDNCGYEKIEEHRMSETPKVLCPKCSLTEDCSQEYLMRRKITPTRVMLKGEWPARDIMETHD